MEYVDIPYVNKKASRLFFGTAIGPLMSGKDGSAVFDAAVTLGINAFDLARVYRFAERTFGKWLEKRGNRDGLVILSKCAHPDIFGRCRVTEKCIRKDFEKTTSELGVDYIDIYLLHRDNGADIATAVESLNALHAEGKIGAFGVSNWTRARIEAAKEYASAHGLIPFTVSSPNFGLARQVNEPWGGGSVTLSGEENKADREWYEQSGMTVIAYSPLGRGIFSGKLKSTDMGIAAKHMEKPAVKGYCAAENFERLRRAEQLAEKYGATVPQIALAWLFKQKPSCCAAVGTMNPANLQKDASAFDIPLTQAETKYLNLETDDRTEV